MIPDLILYAVAAVLVAAVAFEFRTGLIPNWLTALPLVLFGLDMVLVSSDGLWGRLAFAVGVLVVGILLNRFSGVGGGAVKLATGLALFLPLGPWLPMIGTFAGAVLILSMCIIYLRKAFGSETSKWYVLRGNGAPLSLPLAATGLIILFYF